MTRPYLPEDVEQRVRAAAQNRCGYCRSPQHLVMARLDLEVRSYWVAAGWHPPEN